MRTILTDQDVRELARRDIETARQEGEKTQRAATREMVARLQGNATCPIVKKTCQAIIDRLKEPS